MIPATNLYYKAVLGMTAMFLTASNLGAQTLNWGIDIGGSASEEVYDIAVDGQDNIIGVGRIYGNTDFDPGSGNTTISTPGCAGYIVKYSATGSFVWVKEIGDCFVSGGNFIGKSVITDAQNNIYVAGYATGKVDLNPGPGADTIYSHGNEDIFLAKYNANGDFLWGFNVGSTGQDRAFTVRHDGSGKLYLYGHFAGTVDFDPGAGTANMTVADYHDVFVAVYDTSGAYQHAFRIPNAEASEYTGLGLDQSGNLVLSGQFFDTTDLDPGPGVAQFTANGGNMFFASYSVSGMYNWGKQLSGASSSSNINSIKYDVAGNVIMCGIIYGTVDFDPGIGTLNLSAGSNLDLFLAKYDASGNLLWAFDAGNSGLQYANRLDNDPFGNIYLTGHFDGSVDFSPGVAGGNFTAPGNYTAYIAAYKPNAEFLWGYLLGTTVGLGTSVVAQDTGQVAIAGFFGGTTDFDPGPGTANHISNGINDLYFISYDLCLEPETPAITALDTVVCPGATATLSASGKLYDAVQWSWTSGSCGGTALGAGDTLTTTIGNTQTIYVRGTGGCSNFGTCDSIRIYAIDTLDPVPVVLGLPVVRAECNATVSAPKSYDVCADTIIGTTSDPTSYSVEGTYSVTWTYDDGNGNLITQNQQVIIDDTTAPVPVMVSLPDSVSMCNVTVGVPSAVDNCVGSISGTTSDPLSYSSPGTYTITWTYNDGHGNSISQVQKAIVAADSLDPVPDVDPLPVLTGVCALSVSSPSATDNCTGSITGTTTDSVNFTTQGTRLIHWTYDDGNGNTVIQIQQVMVTDTVAPVPVLSSLPDSVGLCSKTVGAPTATDNCSGSIIGNTVDSTSFTTQGTRLITWIFDDGNGNLSQQVQKVIVHDSVAPVISCPKNVTDSVSQPGGTFIVNNIGAAGTDSCGSVSFTYVLSGATTGSGTGDASGTTFNVGQTQITYTGKDLNGNSITCKFNVNIVDPFVGVSKVLKDMKFRVYPNPSQGIVRIEKPNTIESYAIRIVSVTGQLVVDEKFIDDAVHHLDLGSVSKGMYLLQIQTEENTEHLQLLLE